MRLAQSIRNVRGVIDHLEVYPGVRSDRPLLIALELRLREDPVAEQSEVNLHVDAGHVTAVGEVDSPAEEKATLAVIRSTPGVASVTDRIEIESSDQRPCKDIEADIRFRYRRDPKVGARLIDIFCFDNHVHLSGSIGTQVERERAEKLAKVPGVFAVQSTRLKVVPWAKDSMQRTVVPAIKPDVLESTAKEMLEIDPRIRASDIAVTATQNGTLILDGNVHTVIEKRVAEKNAKNVVGVGTIRNEIEVIPPVTTTASQVKQELMQVLLGKRGEPSLSTDEVQVVVKNGVATIHGEAEDYFVRRNLERQIAEIPGITSIKNELTVE